MDGPRFVYPPTCRCTSSSFKNLSKQQCRHPSCCSHPSTSAAPPAMGSRVPSRDPRGNSAVGKALVLAPVLLWACAGIPQGCRDPGGKPWGHGKKMSHSTGVTEKIQRRDGLQVCKQSYGPLRDRGTPRGGDRGRRGGACEGERGESDRRVACRGGLAGARPGSDPDLPPPTSQLLQTPPPGAQPETSRGLVGILPTGPPPGAGRRVDKEEMRCV